MTLFYYKLRFQCCTINNSTQSSIAVRQSILNHHSINHYLVHIISSRSLSTDITKDNSTRGLTNSNDILDPWFITGFSDAESSFSVSCFKNDKLRNRLGIPACFFYWITLKRFTTFIENKQFFQ